MNTDKPAVDAEMESLQLDAFRYFLQETNPQTGLVLDKTAPAWPASIAATGLALAAYPVAVERGFITRTAATERVLATLRFFWNSRQGPEPDATGYHGFYYHFLDMQTGRRAWQCELSTVDSTILLAGALTAGAYFGYDRGKGTTRPCRRALPPRRLAMGARRRRHGHARVEARKRIPGIPVAGLRRGACAVYPGTRLTDASAAGAELLGVGFHIRVEKQLRVRLPVRRSVVHAPDFACLDRLSRYSGRIHAR
jgi:hypothetical protein